LRIAGRRSAEHVRSLGIDVGVGKGLDLVLLDQRLVPLHVLSRVRVPDVSRLIGELRPDVVAIDAPPRWAPNGRSRLTERELATLNIQSFNTPGREHGEGNRFYGWMRIGFDVYERAEAAGFPTYRSGKPLRTTLEVFPHASAVVLAGALPPKGARKRAWREAVLRGQGVRTDELTSADRVDAALAALTGLLALGGKRFAPGDPTEGVIVVPSASLPATPYRPAARAPRQAQPLFAYCACGDPDCQELVRGEFAPGHDTKRKAMLWARVREGADSADELRNRGWQSPPEMR
jgi:predicted nuclease with RNAse H fold